jgi:2-polyprenyl-3-methyl-5-hydroxy-6-metoxy-1,4-benzoquinol methylase
MEKIKCALCGSGKYTLLLQAKDYRLHTTEQVFDLVCCLRCGLVYLNPRPDKEELAKFYPPAFYAQPTVTSKFFSDFLHSIKLREVSHLKNGGRILDVGCGEGGLLSAFKARGWEVYGLDTSETATKLSQKRIGEQYVFNCELRDSNFPDNFFDVITLNHVLEHISYPNEELHEISRILKNDGVLHLSVPNIDSFQFKICREKWVHLDLPRHLYHYSPSTIRAMLQKNNFDVMRLSYPPLDFPLDFYHSLKSMTKSSKILQAFDLFLLATSLMLKQIPVFRGTMEVAAKKVQQPRNS